jgi:hypothetical protein
MNRYDFARVRYGTIGVPGAYVPVSEHDAPLSVAKKRSRKIDEVVWTDPNDFDRRS